MKRRSLGLAILLLLLLAAACSRETRSSIATRVLPAMGTAAAESGIALQTAAVEAAQTNAPIARTAAAQAVRTGGPIAGTLAADSVDLAGTLGAEIMTTGRPLAATVIHLGGRAVETRQAAEPFYQCPQVTYTPDTDLNGTADISGEQMAAALAASAPGTPLTAYGDAFVSAARARGINAYYVAAHAAYDSAWGFNDVATRKNNLFGYGVTPTCGYDCAVPFASQADSIEFVTQLVKADYLTPGGRFYTTGTLAGMETIYNGNPNWAEGVADVALPAVGQGALTGLL
ncbi:MAG: glucosaminidase domain-containing protein [Candidatus Promineofilum sp.]|nr:glucosaminidase domain-containing protein [Promineifilum sp.]